MTASKIVKSIRNFVAKKIIKNFVLESKGITEFFVVGGLHPTTAKQILGEQAAEMTKIFRRAGLDIEVGYVQFSAKDTGEKNDGSISNAQGEFRVVIRMPRKAAMQSAVWTSKFYDDEGDMLPHVMYNPEYIDSHLDAEDGDSVSVEDEGTESD